MGLVRPVKRGNMLRRLEPRPKGFIICERFMVNLRSFFGAIALSSISAAIPLTADAGEYQSCSHHDDAARKKKCNKAQDKYLAKNKKGTKPYKPSKISPQLAHLDEKDQNPFATDDWYLGTQKVGAKPIDNLLGEVDRAVALIKMSRYIGYLNSNGQKDEAVKLAKVVAPELKALKDLVPTLKQKASNVQSKLPKIIEKNPAIALKAPGIVKNLLADIATITKDLPGAVKAVGPLAKGSI